MMPHRIEMAGFPEIGCFVWCDSVRPPKWWSDIQHDSHVDKSQFNCAMTVGKRYEVLGYDELPVTWKSGRFGAGYLLLLIEDDDGYIIAFDPERFHVTRT